MVIPVLVEPGYAKAIWAREVLEGINREALKRKYRPVLLDAEKYDQTDYDSLFGTDPRLVILAAVSVTYVPGIMRFFAGRNIHVLLINYDEENASDALGIMRMDYESAAEALLHYLQACGKERIALYGVNPDSSTDLCKLRAYDKWAKQQKLPADAHVFYNHASLADCYEDARSRLGHFDAVICTNNIVASSLMQHLTENGICVPDDLFVAAMTDSLLLERLPVPVTAVSPDYENTGSQAVMLYAYLCRRKEAGTVSVCVPYRFAVRKSTGLIPWQPPENRVLSRGGDSKQTVDFYSDREVLLHSHADRLLNICDETDLRLIRGLLTGETYDSVSLKTYLTVDSLKYRKKRMMKAVNCEDNEEFAALLRFCDKLGIL